MDYSLAAGLVALGVIRVGMIYSARDRRGERGYNGHYYLERQGEFLVVGVIGCTSCP